MLYFAILFILVKKNRIIIFVFKQFYFRKVKQWTKRNNTKGSKQYLNMGIASVISITMGKYIKWEKQNENETIKKEAIER